MSLCIQMHYFNSQQFMLIYLSMHILTKFTHKTGHLLVPSRFITELLGYQNTPQNPKTSVPGSKPDLNTVQDYSEIVPKILFGLSANNPKNSTRTVRKQFRNSTQTVRKNSKKFLKIPTPSPKNWGLKFTTFHSL